MNESQRAAQLERIRAKIKALAKTENEREQLAYLLYLLSRLNFIEEVKADQNAGELQSDPAEQEAEQEARAKPEEGKKMNELERDQEREPETETENDFESWIKNGETPAEEVKKELDNLKI